VSHKEEEEGSFQPDTITVGLSSRVSVGHQRDADPDVLIVNLLFILVMLKDQLTDLCGNRLLLNSLKNALCEKRIATQRRSVLIYPVKCETLLPPHKGAGATPQNPRVQGYLAPKKPPTP
jgi:hypothetical protein